MSELEDAVDDMTQPLAAGTAAPPIPTDWAGGDGGGADGGDPGDGPGVSTDIDLLRAAFPAVWSDFGPEAASADPSQDLETAEEGLRGADQSLPFLDEIHRAFGPHDLSQVRAAVGGQATTASKALGADAYAVGSGVAFGRQPDLRTAAHEAAHVVQQRAGVHLHGGVGECGDSYEQQADAVADRVLAGRSAVDLLGSPPSNVAQPTRHNLQLSAASTQGVTIDADLVGHASPRWERTHGKDRHRLNKELSRQRVDTVASVFRSMLGHALADRGIDAQFDVDVQAVNDEAVVGIHDSAVGDERTEKEAHGDQHANAAEMRRVDISVTVTAHEVSRGGQSTTETVHVPEKCEPEATDEWGIKLDLSGGAGHAGVGGTGALGTLKNRRTGKVAHGYFVGAGAGVGLSTPGTGILSSYSDFTTDKDVTFRDFDGVPARLTSAGAGLGIIGYSFTYFSFPTLGANSIDLGGASMGQLGADASTNVGVWWLDKIPDPSCSPEHDETRDVEEDAEYAYDKSASFEHSVRFETQSATLSDVEKALLSSFVDTVAEAYE